MLFIDYEEKYENDVKDLILELQNYIVDIDKDNLNIVTEKYQDEAFTKTMQEIKENNGKIIMAVESDKCVGFIVGVIVSYDEFDYIEYKCPKKGEITELIVTKTIESKGVGSKLMELMENYLISKKCEYISLDVFAYNERAINFYSKKGYHNRLYSMIKKIGR